MAIDPNGELRRPMSQNLGKIGDALSELETPFREVINLVYAARMLASSDDIPGRQGAALDTLADTILNKVNALEEERERIWRLVNKECEACA